MNLSRPRVLALLPLLLTAACVNNVVLQNPGGQPSAAHNNLVAQPCMLPADQRGSYATAVFVNTFSVQAQRAHDEKMDGCVSVKFRLTMEGKPLDVTIVKEYPPNYGYGDAMQQSIRGSTFKPPLDTNQWYFMMITQTFNKNASR